METVFSFKIDAGNPRNSSAYDATDATLSEAIYTIFPMDTEDAMLFWGDEGIPLSYRYDISTMIDDILEMLSALQSNDTGTWSVAWSSNTFAGTWDFKWFENSLDIKAYWREEFEASEYLKTHTALKVERTQFINEWKKITRVLLLNLEKCGCTRDNLIDMWLLLEASK